MNGLAEGAGSAKGTAEYRGEFKAGHKHGKGVKTWPTGDRYEGQFVEDRKEGVGLYVWGRGPWAGERYEGGFRADKRQGFGTYRYATGDVYAGQWDADNAVGQATPMMLARHKFEEEAKAAVAVEGVKVCREMQAGSAERDWLRGVVAAVAADKEKIGVRIEDPGKQAHVVAGVQARKGEVVWDAPREWTPCW